MISKLNVQNYKCLVSEEVEFNNLTILAGGNAVGKSSVIQSILLLKKAYDNISVGEIWMNDVYGVNLGLPKDIIAKERTSEAIMINAIDNCGIKNEVILTVGEEFTKPLSMLVGYVNDNIGDKSPSEMQLFSKGFQYLNAERIGPRITSDMSSSTMIEVGNRGEYTNHAIYKADRLKYEIEDDLKSSKIARFSANCEGWLDLIIPGTQLDIDLHDEINKATIKYKKMKTSSDFYLPTATGFGITYVLPIIVAGLLSTINKGSILVVENPEAHLHPYGQSQIGKFLGLISCYGVQVIIETHSEHVINGARLQLAKENKTKNMTVNFFSQENDSMKIEKISINQYGELGKWPKGFFDQNKKDLKELLELRLCRKV